MEHTERKIDRQKDEQLKTQTGRYSRVTLNASIAFYGGVKGNGKQMILTENLRNTFQYYLHFLLREMIQCPCICFSEVFSLLPGASSFHDTMGRCPVKMNLIFFEGKKFK